MADPLREGTRSPSPESKWNVVRSKVTVISLVGNLAPVRTIHAFDALARVGGADAGQGRRASLKAMDALGIDASKADDGLTVEVPHDLRPTIRGGKIGLPWYLIDPRTSHWIAEWEVFCTLIVIFVAIYTPFEVGFLPPANSMGDYNFIVNRCLDLMFSVDICIQFFVLRVTVDRFGDRWITNHRAIVVAYLRGWFPIDLLSTVISSIDFYTIQQAGKPGNEGLSHFKVRCACEHAE